VREFNASVVAATGACAKLESSCRCRPIRLPPDEAVLRPPDGYSPRRWDDRATFTWPASPFLDDGLRQLDPHGMTASAQPPGSIDPCCTADVAANAVDDDATTRWTTGTGQQPGQYLQVDLGRSQPVSRLVLDTGASTNATCASSGDYPRGYVLYVSQDGSTWEGPEATGVGTGQLTDIEVPGGSVRYLRMVSTAASSSWWSVADLRVYQASG
jgi:glucosylceramidase